MIEATPYTAADREAWDALVRESPHATFLHSRRFLDYHGDRFVEGSLVFRDEGRLVAVFPAAVTPGDPTRLVSHPGATYGGVVTDDRHDHPAHLDEMLDALAAAARADGRRTVVYKPVPMHLQVVPSQSDVHGLWRRGAVVTRRDLWNVVPTGVPRSLTKGHKWSLGRARKNELAVHQLDTDQDLVAFHAFLAACLAERHQTSPVHSADELLDLRRRLGDDVALVGVKAAGSDELRAASWVFRYGKQAWHTQYIASNLAGRDTGATVLLLAELLRSAEEAGVPWFSFGASTEEAGRVVNHGLFAHKASFGPGSVLADTLTWDLDAPPASS